MSSLWKSNLDAVGSNPVYADQFPIRQLLDGRGHFPEKFSGECGAETKKSNVIYHRIAILEEL